MSAPPPGTAAPDVPLPGAKSALALLLGINLFNYIDRQVLSAVLPRLQLDGTIFAVDDPNIQLKSGALTSAFMIAYMLVSPIVGWLDGHGYRRWFILGLGVGVWSLASGSSGFATGYWALFLTRVLVGVGEGAYGPVASAMLAEIYPKNSRGYVMALFNMAIPVGSALGFIIGGQVAQYYGDWRHAFWITYAGLALAALCFVRREFARPPALAAGGLSYSATLSVLKRNRSFVLCCVGMTAVTFVIGGLAAWVPTYVLQREARYDFSAKSLEELETPPKESFRRPVPAETLAKLAPKADDQVRTRLEFREHLKNTLTPAEEALYLESVFTVATTPDSPSLGGVTFRFGLITVLGGLSATAAGAWIGEKLRPRLSGAYFWVIGVGALLSIPFYLMLLYAPFPLAWVGAFFAIFGLFLHVGPAFTLIANVVSSRARATAFAVNILVIHALGDVISPPLIGLVADYGTLQLPFLMLTGMIALGGVLWLIGASGLDADTRAAEAAG